MTLTNPTHNSHTPHTDVHPHTNVHTRSTATYTLSMYILMKEGRVMTEEACEAGIDKFYGLSEVAEESRALRGSSATNQYTPSVGHNWSLLQHWSKWTHDS